MSWSTGIAAKANDLAGKLEEQFKIIQGQHEYDQLHKDVMSAHLQATGKLAELIPVKDGKYIVSSAGHVDTNSFSATLRIDKHYEI